MKKVFKQFISVLLAVCIILCSVYIGLNELDFNMSFMVGVHAASVDDFTFTLNDSGDSYSVTKCNTSVSGDVVIPNEYNNLPVKEIGKTAFYNCTNITSITIPDSVINICDNAFWFCNKLASITIADSVTTIGKSLFFMCDNLVTITIGNSLSNIGDLAFSGCTSLEAINVYENNADYSSVDGVLFNKNKTALIKYPEGKSADEYVIPDSVTSLNDDAFYACSKVKSIIIPDGVTTIGENAFDDCRGLISVVIPDSITKIGKNAFSYCSNLESVYIEDLGAWCGIDFGGSSSTPMYYAGNLYLNGELLTELVIPDDVTNIEDYVFYNCTTVTSVDIPDTVTSIGSHSFYGCTGLSSIVIPQGITTIDSSSFCNCTNLTSVTIPVSVKNIWNSAFDECTQLKYVFYTGTESDWNAISISSRNTYLTDSVIHYSSTDHSYGEWEIDTKPNCTTEGKKYHTCLICDYVAFGSIPPSHYYVEGYCSGCGAEQVFQYAIDDDSVTITGYTGTDIDIVIPSIIDGLPVDFIGKKAFYGLDIVSVTIPVTVINIGNEAFNHCTELASVEFSERITHIGNMAFHNCESLTSINLPENITYIGEYAFAYCKLLTNITIPKTVVNIGNYAFSSCDSLSSITVDDGNINYSSSEGVLFNKDKTELIVYPACKTANEYTIPHSVTNISGYAFTRNSYLKTVTIPDTVTDIGSYAFYKCSNISSIAIGNGVRVLAWGVFNQCVNLTSVTIGKNVDTIKDYAFDTCTSLSEIIIPKSVISIGRSSFFGCTSLTAIIVEDGNSAYTSVDGVLLNESKTTLLLCPEGKTQYTMPDSVTDISEYAFAYCKKLEYVELSDNLINIGTRSFFNCIKLKSVILPYSLGVIGYCAFYNCSALKRITIPGGVIRIEDNAFSLCSNLSSINVDKNNFYYSSVDGVLFNIKQTTLIQYPLAKPNVKYTIPDSVTKINIHAFYTCVNLEDIVIPLSVKNIDHYAFADCTRLRYVFYNGSESDWDAIEFGDKNTYLTDSVIHYNSTGHTYDEWRITQMPTCTEDGGRYHICTVCYKEEFEVVLATGHNFYAENCRECDEKLNVTYTRNGETITVTGLSGNALDILFINEIIIPSKIDDIPVTAIAANAFKNRTRLESVIIADGITAIGEGAFYGCTGIESITIPDTVTDIGNYAFYNCRKITSIIIADTVTTIGESAFEGCRDLQSVEFGDGITSVGENAFANCESLEYAIFSKIKIENISLYFSFTEATVNSDKTKFIGTGNVITVAGGSYDMEFTAVVKNDVTGDGVCDVLDCAQTALVANNLVTVDGAYAMASDNNNDDLIDINDYQAIINKAIAS